ncbi:MAG: FKBP-type peptidyl-prolyl cis-trans isomerase, partial [Muribaculaceae bacterium]|nr:FKBP-type peptidyl-prolyl cis-trans isomerase [Muribaculaceae bacterium]
SNLMPLDNSTVDVKYCLRNIEGTVIESSYSTTTYGDSIYRTQPNANVIGFWTGLTNMHVGDSVTMVIPYQAGYGSASQRALLPFSTLIFDVKLKSIYRYETPND